MAADRSTDNSQRLRYVISIAIILSAAITGLIVLRQITANPRTDDAEVFANYIGIAPLVNGPITHLYVSDNQLVRQGDPLLDIDERPYTYAFARAKSDQQALKGEVNDERRIIAGKVSGVDVAKASALGAEASLQRAVAAVEQSKADVAGASAAVERADAELTYASSNLHRIEPLLVKQFVTPDQVDQGSHPRNLALASLSPSSLAARFGGGRTGSGGSPVQAVTGDHYPEPPADTASDS
jgi:multidrug efflux system membrane fusion protein